MSGALASLPHRLTRSRRCYTDGYAIARPVPLGMPQFVGPFGSSHAALGLATKLINPLVNGDPRTSAPQLLTETAGATHKSP